MCLCGSRILVERGIYNEFRDALVERALALRIGDPMDPDAQMGPLVSQAHFDKVAAAIARAREEGGPVLCGGNALDRPSRFVAPTDPKSVVSRKRGSVRVEIGGRGSIDTTQHKHAEIQLMSPNT